MSLLEKQYQLLQELERLWENFNKDGRERKSKPEYFKKAWAKLDELWKAFQGTHEQICMEISQTDVYFTENYYEQAKEIYNKILKAINAGYSRVSNPAAPGTSSEDKPEPFISNRQEGSATPQPQRPERGSYSRLDESLRKQEANFRAFVRTIANINIENMSEKWEFQDALKTLESRWTAIDNLHLEIDSELMGSNLQYEASFCQHEEQFNNLKKEINKKLWSASYREKSTPKLDIPVFNGNYNNWVSFKDLFTDAIHNNSSMPNSQKMQILKTKVKGEAERLIQHLYISSENYASCWEILNHRYNNKKLIFTSHMNILFSLTNIQHNSVSQIKRMHDVALETLNAVKNLGVDITTWDPILVHLLSQKLDSETYNDYLESLKQPRELPVLQELLEFLESRFTNLETSSRRKQDAAPQKINYQHSFNNQKATFQKSNLNNSLPYNNNRPKTTGHWSIAKSCNVTNFTCPMCKHEHGIYKCKSFLQLADDKKLNTVNKLGLCINCLFSHNGKECNSKHVCRKCSQPHNTILHDALEKSRPSTSVAIATPTRDSMTSTSHVSQGECSEVLLATAQLKVLRADGQYHTFRALVDQGSQISLITEHAAQILGLKREKCRGVIYGVGQRENNCKGKINITCASMYNDYTFNAEVVIMSHLIKSLPNNTFSKPSWTNIQNINLADPEFYVSRPVDLLLGADIYSNIILSGIIKGDDASQPIAQQTQLGWLLCGSAQLYHCNVIINNIQDIQQFWEIEDIAEEGEMSSEEIHCVKYFQDTTIRKPDGRYEVRLPMKPNFEKHLGMSKQKALAQFRNLERKFEQQGNLATAYKSFMREYLDLKHMHVANSNTTLECYLPHHGVERAESSTTKYRVVFNASSKTTTGYSLNDLMYKLATRPAIFVDEMASIQVRFHRRHREDVQKNLG